MKILILYYRALKNEYVDEVVSHISPWGLYLISRCMSGVINTFGSQTEMEVRSRKSADQTV